MKLFQIDSPLMRTLAHITDMVILNVMWIICSIPVVTMGASTAALFGCFLNESKETLTITRFWNQFRGNFKKATIIWIAEIPLLLVIMVNIWFYYSQGGAFSITRILLLIPAVILGVGLEYWLPLQSHFENSIRQTMKNGFLISLAHFPISLLILAIQIFPVVLAVINIEWFLRVLPVFLLVGKSGITQIAAFLFQRVFRHYINE